ncbi:MAG: peptidase T [Saprospiraceae bacterium]|nr:peptidase T [Saprospiraceae bacterium]
MLANYKNTVTERFMRYVQIDTQSDPNSTSYPSTEKQKDLGRLLVKELKELGLEDAMLDEFGYVYATLNSNSDKKKIPTICFCSHVDTAPDCSGKDVKPIIHKNYQGKDIVLPDNKDVVIRLKDHEDLKDQIGNDIITASGNTLLGADDKAGVAEIMDAIHYLVNNPQVKHGTIKVLFTPDEEIGRGTDKVDLKKLGADYGYTMDGETLGTIEDETFSADAATISIEGVSTHPGYAKGKMEHAIKIASDIVSALPKSKFSPETTSNKQSFVHPVNIEGKLEFAKVQFILRSFTNEGLTNMRSLLEKTALKVMKNYPNSKLKINFVEQYRNMKEVLVKHPQVAANAVEAVKRSGINPIKRSIRGGTDGSRLSFMGLPCPNIFTGEHAFHSRQEWVSVQDMEKATETIVHLCQIWEERAK